MNVLAANIDFVVIVGRNRQRHCPDEAIFKIGRGPPARRLGPDLNVACLSGPEVVALDDSTHAARSGGARPDDVIVFRIWCSPAALATGDRLPSPPGYWRWSSGASPPSEPAGARIAGPTIRRAVLLVAVHVVGNLIVDSDVVNLSDGKLDMFPGSAASNRYRHSTVICYSHPIGIDWVDPDVVIVSARRACKWGYLGCLAAIQRHRERSCQVIGFIFIVRRDCHPKVIVSAAAHVAV